MTELAKQLSNGGVWIPAKNRGSQWLLIALHGSRGSGKDFQGLEEIFQLPELNYLFVNGPINFYSSYSWYEDTSSRYQAYNYLTNTLDLCQQAGYPPEKIFLLGFSQGAALTFEFGVRYQKLLAGYIAISGRIEELSSLINEGNQEIIRQAKWLVTHGREDYNLSLDIIQEQVKQLRESGFQIDFHEYDKIHEMDATKELPEIRDWIHNQMR